MKYLKTDYEIMKMLDIYTMEYSVVKKNEIMKIACQWI